jgi:hypothetical protein
VEDAVRTVKGRKIVCEGEREREREVERKKGY